AVERPRARAAAARPHGGAHRGGIVRHWRGYRAHPSRCGARRPAGRDLHLERAWPHRADGAWADRRGRRTAQADVRVGGRRCVRGADVAFAGLEHPDLLQALRSARDGPIAWRIDMANRTTEMSRMQRWWPRRQTGL